MQTACPLHRPFSTESMASSLAPELAEPDPPPATFDSLPRALAVRIFAFLPVDERLVCAKVCPLWCEHVSEPSLWTHLDFARLGDPSHLRGDAEDVVHQLRKPMDLVCSRRKADALLRAAAARAAEVGGLRTLDVSRLHPSHGALVEVMMAHAATLREVRVGGTQPWRMFRGNMEYVAETQVNALLAAAPRLKVLSVAVKCKSNKGALSLLRIAAKPKSPLQLRVLHVDVPLFIGPDTDTVVWLARAIGAHPHVQKLELDMGSVRDARALDALADALAEPQSQLQELELWSSCGVGRSADVGALAALLRRRTSLTELHIMGDNDDMPKLDTNTTSLLGAALRREAKCTLTFITLSGIGLWRNGGRAALALVAGLARHPTLCRLDLSCNDVARVDGSDDDKAAVCPVAQALAGRALGALLAADARALTALHVSSTPLGDAGMAPVLLALRCNTHLRELYCTSVCMSSGFAKTNFLPAVRGNTSLRKLSVGDEWEEPGTSHLTHGDRPVAPCALYEAEHLVKQRTPRLSAADAIYASWPA